MSELPTQMVDLLFGWLSRGELHFDLVERALRGYSDKSESYTPYF